jgi:hypothetical protein
VQFSIFVPDCAVVESAVHDDLRRHRVSDDREFFRVALPEAQAVTQRRAGENIAAYPGRPDPKSMKSHADSEALRTRQEAEDQRRRREREKLAAEKREHEDGERRWQQARADADTSTRKTLASGPVGWGTIALAVFWLMLGVGGGHVPVTVLAVGVTVAAGLWLRADKKNDAQKERAKLGLSVI